MMNIAVNRTEAVTSEAAEVLLSEFLVWLSLKGFRLEGGAGADKPMTSLAQVAELYIAEMEGEIIG